MGEPLNPVQKDSWHPRKQVTRSGAQNMHSIHKTGLVYTDIGLARTSEYVYYYYSYYRVAAYQFVSSSTVTRARVRASDHHPTTTTTTATTTTIITTITTTNYTTQTTTIYHYAYLPARPQQLGHAGVGASVRPSSYCYNYYFHDDHDDDY